MRERQVAAALGLPSRIRDEDCDIEPLSATDLESEALCANNPLFGSCQPEHITYTIKMVEIARLRKCNSRTRQLLTVQKFAEWIFFFFFFQKGS